LDKTATELSNAGKMQEIIIVAVDCSLKRYLDYRGPAYPDSEEELSSMKRRPFAPGENSRFERYGRFLIDELKSRIDREYRTKRDAANTAIMGSSMGGICSLALAWEHPQVFGKVASLSGAFQVEKKHFLKGVLQKHQGTLQIGFQETAQQADRAFKLLDFAWQISHCWLLIVARSWSLRMSSVKSASATPLASRACRICASLIGCVS
jgi:enterochelin esterase-like enzyme